MKKVPKHNEKSAQEKLEEIAREEERYWVVCNFVLAKDEIHKIKFFAGKRKFARNCKKRKKVKKELMQSF